jgi:hypothetical protein
MHVRTSAMTLLLIAAAALPPCASAQTSGGEVLTLGLCSGPNVHAWRCRKGATVSEFPNSG